MKNITIILFLLMISNSYADEPRYRNVFFSSNKLFEFKLTEIKNDSLLINNQYFKTTQEVKWSVINKKTKEKIYDIKTVASEKTAYVSDDGEYILIINDWPSGRPDDNLEMISIYKNGNLTKIIKLHEILDCGYNVSSSVSHFHWIMNDLLISFENKKISFTTFELNEIKIDINNGNLSKAKNKNVLENSVLVYGKIITKSRNNYTLEICHKALGTNLMNTIEFTSEKSFQKNRYYTVLLNGGKEINIVYNKQNINDILLNACLTEPKKIKEDYIGFGRINCN